MSEFETPSVYRLPPLEGPIQSRFDGSRHPLLEELNQALDRHGSEHGRYPGTYTDASVGGDPFYLSGDLSEYAKKLAAVGEEELAVEVLDEGTRWPETHIHGAMYQDLAVDAAEHGKYDLALAIALDSNRMLAGKGAKHFDEVYQDEDASYRMAGFAERWLSGASRIYEAVVQNGVSGDSPALRELSEKISLYASVLGAQSSQEGFPKSRYASPEDTNWIAVGIGSVCTSLYRAGASEVAVQLEGLDPEVATYTSTH